MPALVRACSVSVEQMCCVVTILVRRGSCRFHSWVMFVAYGFLFCTGDVCVFLKSVGCVFVGAAFAPDWTSRVLMDDLCVVLSLSPFHGDIRRF